MGTISNKIQVFQVNHWNYIPAILTYITGIQPKSRVANLSTYLVFSFNHGTVHKTMAYDWHMTVCDGHVHIKWLKEILLEDLPQILVLMRWSISEAHYILLSWPKIAGLFSTTRKTIYRKLKEDGRSACGFLQQYNRCSV